MKTGVIIAIIVIAGLAIWGYTLMQAPKCGCGA